MLELKLNHVSKRGSRENFKYMHHLSGENKIENTNVFLFSGVPDYFDRNKISSGGDLSHYSSASLY